MKRFLVSTVVRGAPLSEGGRLLLVDLSERRVIRSVPVYPSNPDIADSGSRGNARGGRGILRVGVDRFVVADYHTLRIVGGDLAEERRVSTPRMVGLHELAMFDGKVLAAATTADRVLEIDLESEREAGCQDLRTSSVLMDQLGLAASAPRDRIVDERAALVDEDLAANRSHLHVNAVAVHDGRAICLLNRVGALVELEGMKIIAHHESLRGAHNVVPHGDELLVNSSRDGRLVRVSLTTGDCKAISLRQDPRLDRIVRRALMRFHFLRRLGRVFPRVTPLSRPFFVRGLVVDGDRAYVGTSPAGIIELDLLTNTVSNWWFFSTDVRECVHGLCLAE
jgi:hypothetical protein